MLVAVLVAHLARHEGSANFSHQLLERIGFIPKTVFKLAIQPFLMARPMGEFMECRPIKPARILEQLTAWKNYLVLNRRITGLISISEFDGRTGFHQDLFGFGIPGECCLGSVFLLQMLGACGLVEIKNSISP